MLKGSAFGGDARLFLSTTCIDITTPVNEEKVILMSSNVLSKALWENFYHGFYDVVQFRAR